MMPSRGVQRVRRDAPRLFQLQCRNLSTATRSHAPLYLRKTSLHPRVRQWQSPASVRHASSWWPFGSKSEAPAPPVESPTEPLLASPPPPPTEASATTSALGAPPPTETTEFAPPPPPPELPNIDTITIDTPDLLATLPEQIGYLKSIGIDYGWGPSSALQWTMEHIHIYTGMPWWGSIAVTSVLLRLVLFPLYVRSSDTLARSQAMTPVTKPITDRMQAARARKDNYEMSLAWQQLNKVRKEAGLSMTAQFTPMLAQAVFGYCGFKILRAAAALPVPAFKTEGFLWLKDLTVPDPYLILPIAMAGVIHMLMRMGGESGAAQQGQMAPQMRMFMLYGMPIVIVGVTGFLPGAVVVWFAAGSALGVVQSLMFQRPKVREWLGIAPLYTPPKGQEDKNPLAAYLEGYMKKNNTIDVKGKVKEDSASASSGVGAAGRTGTAGMGKNEVFMRPTYQKPNLRFTSPARASSSSPTEVGVGEDDLSPPVPTPSSSADEMIPPSGTASEPTPPGGSGGVLDRASGAWKRGRELARNQVTGYIQKQSDAAGHTGEGKGDVDKRMREREKEVFRRRSEEYEKRKQAKKGSQAKKGKGT